MGVQRPCWRSSPARIDQGLSRLSHVRSHHLDAALDRLLDVPEKAVVTGLKAQRKLVALSARGWRWTRRRWGRDRSSSGVLLPSPVLRQQTIGCDQSRGERFVLYRIIGNDLYPRHDAGQSLANLQFILEHESSLEGCEKRWLLNRIRHPDKLDEIISLLQKYGYGYDVIPFDATAFAAVPWDWGVLPSQSFLASRSYRKLLSHQRQGWEIALYRHKNNYLMNNNGARNRALELGRERADWVLPWDGNCFVTPAGWSLLRDKVLRCSASDYFYVPMQRIADNAQLLDPSFEENPQDEPQLVFAASASECFNPAFPYGRRPKVELFWRLGLNGPWDSWPDEPWDQPRRPPLHPRPDCPEAGWVARLHSGVRDRSSHAAGAVLNQARRFGARNLAIKASINQALVAPAPLSPSVFSSFWSSPDTDALCRQAPLAMDLLHRWDRWWAGAEAPPRLCPEQWISVLVHLVWLACLPGGAQWVDVSLIDTVGSCWFREDEQGLQPRLRLLRRPLRAGRLPGTEPSLAAVEQLALLSDLLVWSGREWSWLPAFRTWRDALAMQLQQLVHPAWLRRGQGELVRLQLVQAVLQRHCGGPTESVDALLRLLSSLQKPAVAVHDHARRELILALAGQHGLLDPALAEELGAPVVGQPLPPLLPLNDIVDR